MRLSSGLDLIIFDCDGVLVDSEGLSMRAHQSLFAELGAAPSAELWAQCFGRKQAEIFAIIEKAVGRVAPPELRAQLWPRTKALFAAELKPTPGLVEFLEALDAPRCVASSSDPERIRFSLEVTGLLRYFDGRLFSAQYVARGKPAPDVFLYAAEKMGAAPESALVIEDSPPGRDRRARGGGKSHRFRRRRAFRGRRWRTADGRGRPRSRRVLERSRGPLRQAAHDRPAIGSLRAGLTPPRRALWIRAEPGPPNRDRVKY